MMADLSSARKLSRLSQAQQQPPQQQHPKLQRNLTMRSRPGRVEPMGRSSLRSKGSSNSSGDRVRLFKNCCRRVVEFLFTQVGVGGVVICYTIVGAIIFQQVETELEDPTLILVDKQRRKTISQLWNLTDTYNTLNKDAWGRKINTALHEHQDAIVSYVRQGYDQRTNEEKWTFPAALMFTLSLITMIGYGDLVPRTEWGKIGVIVYACIGIPVYILYFMNMGKVFARVLKWVYTKAYRWNVKRKWKQAVNYEGIGNDDDLDEAYMDELEQQVIVPSTTCLWVIGLYLLLGTIMFAEWEGWNYLDAVYFCVTSLGKIGLGDFVPATGNENGTQEVKLVINFIYLLMGMAIVAMCYYLLKEEVSVKLQRLQSKIADKVLQIRHKMGM